MLSFGKRSAVQGLLILICMTGIVVLSFPREESNAHFIPDSYESNPNYPVQGDNGQQPTMNDEIIRTSSYKANGQHKINIQKNEPSSQAFTLGSSLGTLWPRPANVTKENQGIAIDISNLNVCVDNLQLQSASTGEFLQKSICLFLLQLERLSFRPASIETLEECLQSSRIFSTSACDREVGDLQPHLRIIVDNMHELVDFRFIPNGTNENYSLHGDIHGIVTLRSESPFGMIRGMQTLLQLFQRDSTHNRVLLVDLPFTIEDQPLFAYRGLLIDSARRHLSVPFIENLLGWMASIKLNVLHWHLSDDGAFPIVLESHPELALRDTMTDSGVVYSRSDIERVITLARAYGIRVIPEFDMPGHCGGWTGIPSLISHCPSFACSRAWSVTLAPDDNAMIILGEVLMELFQLFPDPYFHLGGDEVETLCWSEDPRLSTWKVPKNKLFCSFEAKLYEIVKKSNKKIIRWQEHWELTLDAECQHTHADIYQMWRNFMPSSVISQGAVAEGKKVITSVDWYLDANCYDWAECWKTDPLKYLGLASDMHGLEGGETCVWDFSEDMWTRTRIPYRAMSAISARLWEKAWKPTPVASNEIGELIKSACLHSATRGFMPASVCTQQAPSSDLFHTNEYQTNRHEQERRMCERIRHL